MNWPKYEKIKFGVGWLWVPRTLHPHHNFKLLPASLGRTEFVLIIQRKMIIQKLWRDEIVSHIQFLHQIILFATRNHLHIVIYCEVKSRR